MKRGLFTSLDEIRFQHRYVQGHIEKSQNPSIVCGAKEIRHSNTKARMVCSKHNRSQQRAHTNRYIHGR